MNTIKLTHTTHTGHRIPGHEGGTGKCARLHGHTYRFEVELTGIVGDLGFVVDFGAVKRVIDEWDHRMLLWEDDPLKINTPGPHDIGVIRVPFIPTAENMAEALAERMLRDFDGVWAVKAEVWETPTTSAIAIVNSADRLSTAIAREP